MQARLIQRVSTITAEELRRDQMTDKYESPLSQRYASQYMLHLFSADVRTVTWRKIWVALAEAEHDLGLPITAEQIDELKAHHARRLDNTLQVTTLLDKFLKDV